MTLQEQPELLWVVVEVESGIPVLVEAHRGEISRGGYASRSAPSAWDVVAN